MKTEEKLTILASAAKYDASCASSGSTRKNVKGGVGNAAKSGICHSWSADGRCISLLKVLMSNDCLYDCSYCANRRSNSIERATFTPEEIAELTINFYLRNYIEGLFLSSAVYAAADATMFDMVEVCRLLRQKYKFNGYIHLKVIPGASSELIEQAGLLVDRMSVNVELPSENSLKRLAPQKSKKSIFTPMYQIGENFAGYREERKKRGRAPRFCPAGHSTQMIIGASAESDLQILDLSERLYTNMKLKRVYFSAYVGVNHEPQLLPAVTSAPPLLREHRLYQADWLLRFYGYQAHELLTREAPHLDEKVDPKAMWALNNFDLFPLDVNRASMEELLRVPGIGLLSARRIIQSRRWGIIRHEDLKKIGCVMKRAKYFLSINGRMLTERVFSHDEVLRELYRVEPKATKKRALASRQLRLF